MKKRNHGNGLSHSDVVCFSNRLARHATFSSCFDSDFERGWNAACKYFAHELRLKLRDVELSYFKY